MDPAIRVKGLEKTYRVPVRGAGLGAARVGDACAIGRPARRARVEQRPAPAAIRVHDPERACAAVVHLVDPGSGEHDRSSVGGDLGIANLLEVEKARNREQGVRPLLGPDRDAEESA